MTFYGYMKRHYYNKTGRKADLANDMAGDEPDSHKSILKAEGFTVDTYIHGLGENANVRSLYVDRATEALEALQK